jgi:hypothetical protein
MPVVHTIGQRREKRAALDAWSAHLLAAAEGKLVAGKVLPFSRPASGEVASALMLPSRRIALLLPCRRTYEFVEQDSRRPTIINRPSL